MKIKKKKKSKTGILRSAAKIHINMSGFPKRVIDMIEYVDINPLQLDVELTKHSGKYAYIAALFEHAEQQLLDIESDVLEVVLLKVSNGKFPPQWALDKYLNDDESWRDLNMQRRLLKKLLAALEHRGKILHNQSAMIKQERFQTRE